MPKQLIGMPIGLFRKANSYLKKGLTYIEIRLKNGQFHQGEIGNRGGGIYLRDAVATEDIVAICGAGT